MTNAEWLTSSDPSAMLKLIRSVVSARKLRLFACACVREVWSLLGEPHLQQCVDLSEQFADDLIDAETLRQQDERVAVLALKADLPQTMSTPRLAAARAAWRTTQLDAFSAAETASALVQMSFAPWQFSPQGEILNHGDNVAKAESRRRQAELLRSIVGNPFTPIQLQPEWLTWNDGLVPRIASEIYEQGRFEEMPVVADALQDAGCDVALLLDNLRRVVPVRGNWTLDLILDRS